jgi:hypothetical protein
MKRLSLIAMIGAGCLLLQNAQATLVFEDGFNYPAGNLNAASTNAFTGNPWTSGSSHITVVNNNLTYSGEQDQGGNAMSNVWGISAGSIITTYANQTSGTLYYSFLVDVTAVGTINSYFTSLNPGVVTPGGSGDALGAYIKSDGSGWEIGMRTAGASTVEDTVAGTAGLLSLNTTYLVVMSYTFATGTAQMWVDPSALGGSAPTADVSLTGGTSTAIDDIGFKAQSNGGATTLLYDNAIIGTTWADVTPLSAPEPSTCALAGLGLLGLVTRFRRTRQ